MSNNTAQGSSSGGGTGSVAYGGEGGGIYFDSRGGAGGGPSRSSLLNITGSLLAQNTASSGSGSSSDRSGEGGGIYATVTHQFAAAELTNSTVSGNSPEGLLFFAERDFFASGSGTIALNNLTVSDSNGDGIKVEGAFRDPANNAIFSIISSIVANSSSGTNIRDSADVIQTALNNLIETSSGHQITNGVGGNFVGVSSLLYPLQDNGGPTFTHALPQVSPAINSGSNPKSLLNDQRGTGFLRTRGSQIDIGAFEFDLPTPEISLSGNGSSIANGDMVPDLADSTDFGDAGIGFTRLGSFTISNAGDALLHLDGTPRVAISGSTSFSVSTEPSSSVPVDGGSTTFTIEFSPLSSGVESAVVSISSDDPDENPFTFAISGTGVDPRDTDGDGDFDVVDLDDDNDGVSDTQELSDGTNPLDAGSNIPVLSTSFCSEWNGFLGLYNINEYSSSASVARNLSVTLFDSAGVAKGATESLVLANSQTDVLVHDLLGFETNQYGRTCTDVIGGVPGEIYGRTTFYHPNSAGTGFDFAFAAPFGNGLVGAQFVPFNTFDPSELQDNFVGNWISVTNRDSLAQTGTMYYYGQDGSILGSDNATIEANGRFDFSAHQFGQSLAGLAEWRPDVVTARATVRNVRYYYDNESADSLTFNSAMPVDAAKPIGEEVVVALDRSEGTAVLELSNASTDPITVSATFRSLSGGVQYSSSITLAGRETAHIITGDIFSTLIDSVTLKSDAISSLIAVSTHYQRDSSGVLRSAYATNAKQALGSVFRGSYNTFLGQDCNLVMVNTADFPITLSITMTRFDGTSVANGVPVIIAAQGSINYSLCANDTANNYGSVLVMPDVPNSVTGFILRNGSDLKRYRFVTELRP